MNENIQGISDITNEKSAEKVEIHSASNREAKQESFRKSSENFNVTKQSEYKPLERVAKQRCC